MSEVDIELANELIKARLYFEQHAVGRINSASDYTMLTLAYAIAKKEMIK